jgi:hypothetical protein
MYDLIEFLSYAFLVITVIFLVFLVVTYPNVAAAIEEKRVECESLGGEYISLRKSRICIKKDSIIELSK